MPIRPLFRQLTRLYGAALDNAPNLYVPLKSSLLVEKGIYGGELEQTQRDETIYPQVTLTTGEEWTGKTIKVVDAVIGQEATGLLIEDAGATDLSEDQYNLASGAGIWGRIGTFDDDVHGQDDPYGGTDAVLWKPTSDDASRIADTGVDCDGKYCYAGIWIRAETGSHDCVVGLIREGEVTVDHSETYTLTTDWQWAWVYGQMSAGTADLVFVVRPEDGGQSNVIVYLPHAEVDTRVRRNPIKGTRTNADLVQIDWPNDLIDIQSQGTIYMEVFPLFDVDDGDGHFNFWINNIDGSGGYAYSVKDGSRRLSWVVVGDNGSVVTRDTVAVADFAPLQWHKLAFYWSSDGTGIVLDGTDFVSGDPVTDALFNDPPNNPVLYLGNRASGGDPISSLITNFRAYDRALSVSELEEMTS